MSGPLVSVIIPTYNRAGLLGRALESVRAQTYPNIQVIVVDDGSTDDTRQVVARFPMVEYHYQENRRQAAARNTGLRHSRGSYIASLDSDDIWEPDFLAKSIACLEQHQLDFVFLNHHPAAGYSSHLSNLSRKKNWRRYMMQPSDSWWLLSAKLTRRLFLESCPAPSSALVIRRTSLAGGWNEQMLIADDWCLILDMVINKKCRSAFQLKPSWVKYVQYDNVYEGLEQLQLIERLGLHDGNLLNQRFHAQLTFRERLLMRENLSVCYLDYAHLLWKKHGISRRVLGSMQNAIRLSPTRSSRHGAGMIWLFLRNSIRTYRIPTSSSV